MKKNLSVSLSLLFVMSILAGIVWIVFQSPPSLQPLLAGGIGFLISSYFQSLKESNSRLYEKKRDVYSRLLNPWKKVLMNKIYTMGMENQEAQITKEMLLEVAEAAFDSILYASDDVIKKYNVFRNCFKTKEVDPANILYFGQLLKSIRKDLGYTFTTLDEVEILSMFINFNPGEEESMRKLLTKAK